MNVIGIIHVLCDFLIFQLVKNYEEREASIKGCIQVSNSRIKELKDESESSSDAAKLLSKEQTKVMQLNNDLFEHILNEC